MNEIEEAEADVRIAVLEVHLAREELQRKLRKLTYAEARLYELQEKEEVENGI